jgi:nitrogen fixation protein NifU and related proteins
MSELAELYQEVILDHNRHPRNFKDMDDATHHADGYNPLCGDKLKVYMRIQNGKIEDISFTGAGCAISKASASMMIEKLQGKTVGEAEELFAQVHQMCMGELQDSVELGKLGKLAALSGVSEFPMRVKCATLAWHAMQTALERKGGEVTTE